MTKRQSAATQHTRSHRPTSIDYRPRRQGVLWMKYEWGIKITNEWIRWILAVGKWTQSFRFSPVIQFFFSAKIIIFYVSAAEKRNEIEYKCAPNGYRKIRNNNRKNEWMEIESKWSTPVTFVCCVAVVCRQWLYIFIRIPSRMNHIHYALSISYTRGKGQSPQIMGALLYFHLMQ